MYIHINISCQEILRNYSSFAKHFRGRSDQRESSCIGSSLSPEAVGRPAVVNMRRDVGNHFLRRTGRQNMLYIEPYHFISQ